MRRQRVLERVGWRFWRCFASSFYRDPDGVAGDLFATLSATGIEPVGSEMSCAGAYRHTEHRTALPPVSTAETGTPMATAETAPDNRLPSTVIGVGDRIVFLRAEDQKRVSITLTEGPADPERGHVSVDSPLGRALLGAEEGDEVEYFDGRQHRISIESTNKGRPAHVAPAVPISGPALVTSAAYFFDARRRRIPCSGPSLSLAAAHKALR